MTLAIGGAPPITVEGVSLGSDDGTTEIVVTGLVGWYDGPDTATNFSARPSAHGSFDGPAYRQARVVTVSGFGYSDSRAALMAALQQIVGVLAEGELGTLTVADPDTQTLSISCRLSAGPLLSPETWENCWDWQFSVTAPDPRKHAAAVTSSTGLPAPGSGGLTYPLYNSGVLDYGSPGTSGQVTLSNPGTADAYPVFTISGPVLGGFTLTDIATGRMITYSDDVPSGSTVVVIDSADGTATLNGSDRTGELTVKQFWAVPRNGGSSTVQFNTLGASGQSGSMSASLQPAYW